ncbi:hypothetical protein ACFSM5_03085 [Lacibacterium aquatile]|uniref:Uncharacterized protein n=1 Tax=Lacibacterium aquatile TaxID=1168082 RepID=A0ABW5DPM9_9PROT
MSHLRLVSSTADIDPAADGIAFAVLAEATAQVVGEVSRVTKVIRTAVNESENGLPVGPVRRACCKAFDSLPGWQRARIAEAALTRASDAA